MTVAVTIMSRIRSQRCQRCRWRKIKCDENWPTCTPCARARCPCSGPPILLEPDSDALSSASVESADTAAGSSSSQVLSHYELPEGSSYIRVRLSVGSPRSSPTTIADRVASRLVGYLEKGSAFDATLAADYLRLLPRRLAASNALRDAVALFCACWGAFRRSPSTETPIDPRAHVKALRSMQRALDDDTQNLSCETLAAATIMERLTVLFDNRQGANPIAHVRGIHSLMLHRGPPNPDDDLDVALAFGNLSTLMTLWLMQGGDNFYVTPPWRECLISLAQNPATDVPQAQIETFNLLVRFGTWPQLMFEVRDLEASMDESVSSQAQALLKSLEVNQTVTNYLLDQTFEELNGLTLTTESLDPESLGGTIYNFTHPDTLNRTLLHLMAAIACNRQRYQVVSFLRGAALESIETEHRRLCTDVWKCIPYIRSLGPISSILYLAPLAITLEAADRGERLSLIKTLMDLDQFLGRLPNSIAGLEKALLDMAQTWTGRQGISLLSEDHHSDGEGAHEEGNQ
ncbi:hypothetical protein B0I35DRAFT_475931 [Stachybotrys elegans]|uniref:Zn(2)-C6 fungal-type domain-containing protein n=1 Tax=Stachybotrys elegans TaxID=80388 RepID=A0A8K0SZC9_9HYPO|nr:hypothetical protein B0I35DRAFT_475931 [Stachybotrys elegans]